MIQEFLYTYVPWLYNKLYEWLSIGKRAALAAYVEVTVPKEWIFLKNVQIPIPSHLFPAEIPEDLIQWRCTAEPPRFQKGDGTLKHLEYLSFVVSTPQDTYDLTDWINDVKWSASEGVQEPSPCEIFLLWCCVTGNPGFINLDQATVTFMNELGEETTEELKTQTHHTSNGIPHLHHNDSAPEADGFDSDGHMDTVFSSGGR
jgi:hypothetical protein